MLLSLQSTNEDYATIRTNIDIPWECKYVKYWISCVNFNANMFNLTDDDCIKFSHVDNEGNIQQHTVYCFDGWYSNRNDLLAKLNNDEWNEFIAFGYNIYHRLTITVRSDVTFTDITPRARMLFGMMNVEIGKVYQTRDEPYVFDVPIICFANKLYIISKQGNAVHANVGKQEMSPSILASIDTVIRFGQPVIVNFETYGKPIKNRVNIDSFKYLELQLVDMMLNPVKLNVPMFITLKVKPCKVPQMRLSE